MKFDEMTKEELIDYINSLNENQNGKYGLVWDKEKEPEQIVVDCDRFIPILKSENKMNLDNNGENNILIEGDNFHSLSVLNYTHKESIDVIYIDPPYNTGNRDFMYNDKYVDPEDGYRHSKWLNFMEKRLKLARNLLKQDGFIAISIDDNEQSQLKLLCDKVFGENNYLNTISVKAKASSGASGGGEDKKLKKNIEYILLYSKNRYECDLDFPVAKVPLYELIQEKRENGISWSYTSVMYKYGNKEHVADTKDGKGEKIELYRVTDFEIKSVSEISKLDNISEEEVYNKYINDIFTTENAQTSIRQRVIDAVGEEDEYYIARYVPVSGRNKGKVTEVGFIGKSKRLVSYLKHTCSIEEDGVYKLDKKGTLWDDLSWSSVSSEGGVPFPAGKKPISLLKRIIAMYPSNDSTILDFFAGSGSTGHATLELNEEDGGNRKFILCTNNENNICEDITYKRLANVVNGYGKKKGLNGSLKFFKTDFVNYEGTRDQLYYDLTEKCIPMLCVKSDTYELIEKNKEFIIYSNKDKTEYSCVYFDIFGESYDKFIEKVKNIKEHKNLYIFSLSEYVNEENFKGISNYNIEPIPYKILDLYKNVVKMSKEN